jgi:hypothetical protein
MKQILYLITFTLLLFTAACEKDSFSEDLNLDSPLKENSLSGDWNIKAYIDKDELFGPFDIEIEYTADLDSIIIKDNDFWGFQVKASVNNTNNTFESNLSVNELSKVGAQIKILNGKVTENESINFEIQFEDDETPYGITYKINGHKIQ